MIAAAKTLSFSSMQVVSANLLPPSNVSLIPAAVRWVTITKQTCVVSADDESSLAWLSDARSKADLIPIIFDAVGGLSNLMITTYFSTCPSLKNSNAILHSLIVVGIRNLTQILNQEFSYD